MHSNPDFRLGQGVEDAYGIAIFLRCTTFRFRNTVFPLILPIEDLGFAHEDVRIMAPWLMRALRGIVQPRTMTSVPVSM